MIWIYGAPKIGKTTLAAQFPGAWFLATEKGHDFIRIREPTPIASWQQFLDLAIMVQDEMLPRAVFGDGKPIRTIVIDTVENLHAMCQDDICARLGIENPGDLDHGKGWNRLTDEWNHVMNKIRQWPFTLVCISHERQKEFKTRGRKVDRYEPNIGASGFRWCQSAADLILFAHSAERVERTAEGELTGEINERRVLLCHPQSWAVAGGRMSGRLPVLINLDEHHSYDMLVEELAGS